MSDRIDHAAESYQRATARAASIRPRHGWMPNVSPPILPLLKAQSAAYDALVAAVDAEEATT